MSGKPNTGGSRPIRAFAIGARGPAFLNPYQPIAKAASPAQLDEYESWASSEWIECPFDRRGLRELVDGSTVLPQCIRSYAANIAGFGIGVRYIDDMSQTDPEAEDELRRAEQVIGSLSLECDTKQVFEHIIESRETYGAAYLEVVRDPSTNLVVQIDFVEDPATIIRSVRDKTPTTVTVRRRGEAVPYRKRFCRYRQRIAGTTVYFREFGDPRVMNMHTGEHVPEGEPIAPEDQANEILEFAIGPTTYGEIRWRGNILGISGAHKAERLNHNYFENGRHTPLLIFLKGGMLTEESAAELERYMSAIKGEAGQHAFIVLCAESTGQVAVGGDKDERPDIELKDLSPMLQKDELFQEYIDNKRKQVQSSFLLPDLYVGYTTDFNRATAETAKKTTEEQVFKSERQALAWTVNNKLLADYGFRHVEAYFKEPDSTNPEDLFRLMTACGNAGGLTPNKAKEIIYSYLGDQSEPYTEPWGEMPIQLATSMAQGQAAQGGAMIGTPELESLGLQLTAQIQKAQREAAPDDVIEVMKSVRAMLAEMREEDADAQAEP